MNKFNKLYTSLINEKEYSYEEEYGYDDPARWLSRLLYAHRIQIQKSGDNLYEDLKAISDDLNKAHLGNFRTIVNDVIKRLRLLFSENEQIKDLGHVNPGDISQTLLDIVEDLDRRVMGRQ